MRLRGSSGALLDELEWFAAARDAYADLSDQFGQDGEAETITLVDRANARRSSLGVPGLA